MMDIALTMMGFALKMMIYIQSRVPFCKSNVNFVLQ